MNGGPTRSPADEPWLPMEPRRSRPTNVDLAWIAETCAVLVILALIWLVGGMFAIRRHLQQFDDFNEIGLLYFGLAVVLVVAGTVRAWLTRLLPAVPFRHVTGTVRTLLTIAMVATTLVIIVGTATIPGCDDPDGPTICT